METSPAAANDPGVWFEKIAASLRAERDGISEFLAVQEQRLEQAEAALQESLDRLEEAASAPAGGAESGGGDSDDYKRRYELALDDLHELKANNAQLQEQLAKARSAAATSSKQGPVQSQGGYLDWESEKRRLLAALEADSDDSDAESRAERLKMTEVIRATDCAIAEKDKEIRELRHRVEELNRASQSDVQPRDGNAAAVAQAVDTDTAVQEERKRLQQLKEECQAKLAQAEIELSLERAKLARERAELEERLRSAENIVSQATALANAAGGAPVDPKASRGRWLSRLGLTDADRERGKRG
jgi:chromosome segregation ATPase